MADAAIPVALNIKPRQNGKVGLAVPLPSSNSKSKSISVA
jgi:hypothetical protein